MYVMNYDHLEVFRRLYGLTDDAEQEHLQPELVKEYWTVKRQADRIGTSLQAMDLVWIAVRSGGLPLPKPKTFLDVAPKVSHGRRVEAQWRFGRWVPGVYHGLNGNADRVVVQLDDETGEDREFEPHKVRLAMQEAVVA